MMSINLGSASIYNSFQNEAAQRNEERAKLDKQMLKHHRLEDTGRQFGKLKELALVARKDDPVSIPSSSHSISKKSVQQKRQMAPLMKETIKQYQQTMRNRFQHN